MKFINIQCYKVVPVLGDKVTEDKLVLQEDGCAALNVDAISYVTLRKFDDKPYYDLHLNSGEVLITDTFCFECIKKTSKENNDV